MVTSNAHHNAKSHNHRRSKCPQPPERPCFDEVIKSLKLSPQQVKIVELLLEGKRDKEIVLELGLSKHTVRTYLQRIFTRLGVTDRMGLVLKIATLHCAVCRHTRCPHK